VSPEEIVAEVRPYVAGGPELASEVYVQLARYLELLLRWNARTNLTAIRSPEEIVRRHFGESLFAARQVAGVGTLMDFGSGAGFPGLPIQLAHPELKVTLAESQNKKATFLREAVRTLGLGTEVWAGRVEMIPMGRRFDVVTLRAVDRIESAIESAAVRADRLLVLTTGRQKLPRLTEFAWQEPVRMPGMEGQELRFGLREP
jgi:16S rRNA (guanine527-N7)-methyltransferase